MLPNFYLTLSGDNAHCEPGFEGNSDLYGLGVRIAFYLQTVMTVIGTFDGDELYRVLTVNLLLAFALFVALIHATLSGGLNNVEAYVTLYLVDSLSFLALVAVEIRFHMAKFLHDHQKGCEDGDSKEPQAAGARGEGQPETENREKGDSENTGGEQAVGSRKPPGAGVDKAESSRVRPKAETGGLNIESATDQQDWMEFDKNENPDHQVKSSECKGRDSVEIDIGKKLDGAKLLK
ncbi:hypothetical protein N656DRAFT_421250 [Canariomyces notabilis]|uniref:Uncharacterized protein n=1 Tax=Canariomyces notabilis TaxID=2074819 RepID=A0AAN6QJM0_9PEZI|nr:hypothetical protein N656DRAFT_421250 [Canariomyces arenarius]